MSYESDESDDYNDHKFRTPRIPIITFEKIRESRYWPKAESSKCSLFEAFNMVGAFQFGPAWTGLELQALDWPLQPAAAEAERLRSVELGWSPSICPFCLDEVAHAQSVVQEQAKWEHNKMQFDRFWSVVEWIAQQCRDGLLTGYERHNAGGHISAMNRNVWIIDDPIECFFSRGGHLVYEGEYTETYALFYVFVDRQQLIDLATYQLTPKRRGRRIGTGYADDKFVKIGLKLRTDGEAKSINDAATKVVERYGSEIEGASVHAKKERIRKAITKLEDNGG